MIKDLLLAMLFTLITFLIVRLNPIDINGKISIGIMNFYQSSYLPNLLTVLIFIIGFYLVIIFVKKGLE